MAYSAGSADNTYSVEVESALTVNVSANSVTLRLNPTSKPFDYGDLDVTITTNHVTGYEVGTTADENALSQTTVQASPLPVTLLMRLQPIKGPMDTIGHPLVMTAAKHIDLTPVL